MESQGKGTIPGTVVVDHSAFTGGADGPVDGDSPDTMSLAVAGQARALELVTDVWGGTFRMRDKKYLRQLPKEEDTPYAERVEDSVLFNALRRTVRGVTGLVYRKPIKVGEDVPPAIVEILDDVDMAGSDLQTFGRDCFQAKSRDGHVHIVTDWHSPTEDPENGLAENGARPYWSRVEKGQVRRFKVRRDRGRWVVTSFAYEEDDTRAEGEFGEVPIHRIKQLDLIEAEGATPKVRYRSWTRDADSKGEWAPETTDADLGPRMQRIPVETDYADRKGFMVSDPPFLDLAHENVKHYRVRSERDMSLGITQVAIIAIHADIEKEKVESMTIGTGVGVLLPKDSKMQFVEAEGHGLEESRQELSDIEHRMASLGLSVLVRRSGQAQTAQAERIHRGEQDSELAASVHESTKALNGVLQMTAEWLGLPDGGQVTVNNDLEGSTITPQMLTVLSNMVERDQLDLDHLWDAVEAGEVLTIVDREALRDRLDQEQARRMATILSMDPGDNGDGGDSGDGSEDDGGNG